MTGLGPLDYWIPASPALWWAHHTSCHKVRDVGTTGSMCLWKPFLAFDKSDQNQNDWTNWYFLLNSVELKLFLLALLLPLLKRFMRHATLGCTCSAVNYRLGEGKGVRKVEFLLHCACLPAITQVRKRNKTRILSHISLTTFIIFYMYISTVYSILYASCLIKYGLLITI